MKWDVTDFVILSSIVLALPLTDKSIMINNNSVQTLSSNQTPLLIKKKLTVKIYYCVIDSSGTKNRSVFLHGGSQIWYPGRVKTYECLNRSENQKNIDKKIQ